MTGWSTGTTAPVYAPSVTRTESPVLQIRKATATTNTVSADVLGLYTEYVPATSTSIRRFNGASDEVVLGIGSNAAAYGTMAVLFRPAAEHFGAPFSTNGASNYARRVGIFNRSPAFSSFDVDLELRGVENQIAPGEWALLVVTKATGTVKPRFHLWKSGTWNHVDATGTLADYAGETQTNVRLGRFLTYNDWFRGDIAAAAHWASKALSDAECEALVTVGSLEGWAGKAPSGLWLFNQVSLSDEVKDKTANGANQTSRSGTAVVAEPPPIPYVAAAGRRWWSEMPFVIDPPPIPAPAPPVDDGPALWEQLYRALGFHREADPDNGFALRKFCEAWCASLEPAYELVRERADGTAAWGCSSTPNGVRWGRCPTSPSTSAS